MARRPNPLHVPALDGVRGIAIALVLLQHTGWPWPFSAIGWVGVDLFFVLSGYLITGILTDTRDAPNRARSFYVRRALRIFPIYYAVLGIVFIIVPVVHPVSWPAVQALVPEQAWYWTYLCDWRIAFGHPRTLTILGHFWTLSIEEQFYWVWPIVIWSLSRRGAARLCVWLIIGASILRLGLVLRGPLRLDLTLPFAFEYLFLPTRIDGLAVGSLIALAIREPGGAPAVQRWMWPAACLGALVLAVVMAVRRTASYVDPVMIALGYPALAFAFGGVVLYAVVRRSWLLELPPLRSLGKYSYGLYVLHHPIMTVARLGFHLPDADVGAGRSFTAIMLPVTCVAAYLSYHLFEKHFLRLKDRLGPLVATTSRPPTACSGDSSIS